MKKERKSYTSYSLSMGALNKMDKLNQQTLLKRTQIIELLIEQTSVQKVISLAKKHCRTNGVSIEQLGLANFNTRNNTKLKLSNKRRTK